MANEETWKCSTCGESKPIRSGRSPCARCNADRAAEDGWREADIRRVVWQPPSPPYWVPGFTRAAYNEMHEAQGGVCLLCGRPETEDTGEGAAKRLAVDHDKETKLARGLLCSACNTGIGKLQHDPARLRKAADYIEEHRARAASLGVTPKR